MADPIGTRPWDGYVMQVAILNMANTVYWLNGGPGGGMTVNDAITHANNFYTFGWPDVLDIP